MSRNLGSLPLKSSLIGVDLDLNFWIAHQTRKFSTTFNDQSRYEVKAKLQRNFSEVESRDPTAGSLGDSSGSPRCVPPTAISIACRWSRLLAWVFGWLGITPVQRVSMVGAAGGGVWLAWDHASAARVVEGRPTSSHSS